ncbi:MAG: VOC family protein [Sphaerobacter sp.]|nr:VOC family protein [Sphaerobacter sp.]
MAATNLNHVSVIARHLDESIRFYEELFGMERVPTPNFGFPVQWLRVGRLQLHLFERPGEAPVYHHLGLTVDDFAAVYRAAKARGVLDGTTFGHHLYELPGKNAQLYLRDPAGNLIEVDYPDATELPADVRADMRRLADRYPQSEENLRATLFLA